MARNTLDGYAAMYRLRVESEFDAAHKIEGYQGKCARLHGHTYKVEAFFLTKELDSIGVSVDLRALKEKLAKITEQFDHSYLNDFKELGNPSTENLSRHIFQHLKDNLPSGAVLEKVRVWETPKSWIEYFEG
jgi:6-pyruvoyltetrahydropterin/6-carboxytetrahydropterin synthase